METNVNRRIRKRVQEMLDGGEHEVYVHETDGLKTRVDDLAVITCVYGLDGARASAARRALSLFRTSYKARPGCLMLIESQYRQEDALFEEFAAGNGFRYVFVERTRGSDGLYIRQALLNIGTRLTDKKKLVYLDAEVGFCNPYWACNVSRLLDKCDLAQPFGYSYRVKNGGLDPVGTGLEKSMLKCYFEDRQSFVNSNTGLGFAMRRETYDAMGGFDVISSPSEDVWFWFKFMRLYVNNLHVVPYQPYMDDVVVKVMPGCRIKACDEVCFHVEHSAVGGSAYAAYVYACGRQTVYPKWDVRYDPASDALPEWNGDDVWIRARKETVRRIGLLGDQTMSSFIEAKRAAKKIIDDVNLESFGPVPAGRKLKVITVLDERHRPEDVVVHMGIVKKRLKADFEYVCLSDVEIEGVKTLGKTVRNDFLGLIDAFRPDVARPDDICLFMSLDAVPVEDFSLCDVPKGFIGMPNPRYSSNFGHMWQMYLPDVILFSGDFSFIY